MLRDEELDVTDRRPVAVASPPSALVNKPRNPAKQPPANTPPAGQWRMQPLPGSGRRQATSVVASRVDAKTPSEAKASREGSPDEDVTPISMRNFVIRPRRVRGDGVAQRMDEWRIRRYLAGQPRRPQFFVRPIVAGVRVIPITVPVHGSSHGQGITFLNRPGFPGG